jgi:hypothetical protein
MQIQHKILKITPHPKKKKKEHQHQSDLKMQTHDSALNQ